MQDLLAAILALLAAPAPVAAAAATAAPGPAQAGGEGDAKPRYFERPIDLWNNGLRHPPPPSPSKPEAALAEEALPSRIPVRENVWAQPIRTPDGSFVVYVPPKEVLDFLENPTESSARTYLAWKAEQSRKLATAMKLLAELRALPAPPAGAPVMPAPPDMPFRITYFKKPSCPNCVSQDAILKSWLAKRPAGALEILLPGERSELWGALEIRGTPTLLLEAGHAMASHPVASPQGGDPSRRELLVGLQSEAALEAALARLALPPPLLPADPPRKEPSR